MAAATDKVNTKHALASLLEENSEKLLTCVHCGLCLPACPTYRELGNENDSPRGRIYLMRGVVEGRVSRGGSFIKHIDLCLGCRACETSCPSGVPYGHLLEAARAEVSEEKSRRRSVAEFILRVILNQLFTRPRLLASAMAVARWMRDSGLARLAFESNLVSGRLRFALALLLASRSPFAGLDEKKQAARRRPSEPGSSIRVALLRGCVMEGLFKEANSATERVLALNGCEVVEAQGQMCCGALHAHAGQIEQAKALARKNIDAFLESGCERVIVNAAGCGAAMKEYGLLLAGDPEYREKAREFSSKVRDVSEFLVEQGIAPPAGKCARRVTYDAPCHLIHAQRIAEAPVALLRAVNGFQIVPLAGAETCCGGAGIYNLQHQDLSAEILSKKIASIRATGADTVATANPGCIMQIGAGLLLEGIEVDVVHPIELVDAAYCEKDSCEPES
ncbi:MAG TPA: heterodisulfide reductase-related iron-sulfur binding cluster [Blastocatellia bacterium]|nr:heterodisulfide reductase-related iron-sulfur binding cluster [Blastocatellia bacterium]